MNHIDRLYARPTAKSNIGGWKERHIGAVSISSQISGTLESSIASLIRSWLQYADAHKLAYESGIGEDSILGDEWERIGKAMRGLLNGELGRLDAGTLDSVICGALTAEGFDPNL